MKILWPLDLIPIQMQISPENNFKELKSNILMKIQWPFFLKENPSEHSKIRETAERSLT